MNHANKLLQHFRKVLQEKTNFPIGTLVYFGPDDSTITKIIAIVILNRNSDPLIKKWEGSGVSSDAEVAAHIGHFFKRHQVKEVVMTDGIIGCPHEEGVDYPVGESCPHCPYWTQN